MRSVLISKLIVRGVMSRFIALALFLTPAHLVIVRRANVAYFRLYDLRSTFATRLSAGGVADEWVTQLPRQTNAQVFKKCSQVKLG